MIELNKGDKQMLAQWMLSGKRSFSDAERLWAQFNQLPEPKRQEVQQALSDAAFGKFPDTTTLPLPIAREIQEEVGRGFAQGGPHMAETVERLPQVHGRYMLCRCHYPSAERPLPVLIYLHGGGTGRDWTYGCAALADEHIRQLFNAIPVGTPVMILP